VYKDRAAAQSFLEPWPNHLFLRPGHDCGNLGGDSPFPAAGCIAQAWSVGELFRAWQILSAASESPSSRLDFSQLQFILKSEVERDFSAPGRQKALSSGRNDRFGGG